MNTHGPVTREQHREWVARELDMPMARDGWSRRHSSIIYKRKVSESAQELFIHHESRHARWCIYPMYAITFAKVQAIVNEIIGDDRSLVYQPTGPTISTPIEFICQKQRKTWWALSDSSELPSAFADLRSVLERWTLPFLNHLTTVRNLCDVITKGAPTLVIQPVIAVAAYLAGGDYARAVAFAEEHMGKPGPRKHYLKVFEYLARHGDTSS